MPKTSGNLIACPKCGDTRSRIADVRMAPHNQIKRRRECGNGHRYNTFENVDE